MFLFRQTTTCADWNTNKSHYPENHCSGGSQGRMHWSSTLSANSVNDYLRPCSFKCRRRAEEDNKLISPKDTKMNKKWIFIAQRFVARRFFSFGIDEKVMESKLEKLFIHRPKYSLVVRKTFIALLILLGFFRWFSVINTKKVWEDKLLKIKF